MKKSMSLMGMGLACAMFGGQAMAGSVVFSDNFDGETVGNNHNSFASWVVDQGSVDVLGAGGYNPLPGNGNYVDLDGSTGDAGRLAIDGGLDLGPGEYILSFDLAGKQLGGELDRVAVRFGSDINVLTRGNFGGFKTFEMAIDLAEQTLVNVVFNHFGGDNRGLLLDNVVVTRMGEDPASVQSQVTSMPTPTAAGLLLMGLVCARRRRSA